MPARKVRTTVALSADLLEAVDAFVQEGVAESRNDFLERAIRQQLKDSRRAAIDAEFAGMAEDRLGSLDPGHFADFIIVDRDITSAAPTDIAATKVLETWMAGRKVWERLSSLSR